METIQDLTEYQTLEEQIVKELSDKDRFVPIEERQDTGVLTADIMSSISHGNLIGHQLKHVLDKTCLTFSCTCRPP